MSERDMSMKQVDSPPGDWCQSGHVAPAEFKRDPAKGPQPTRFFDVCGNGITGTYCEPCLVIAQWAARQKKKAV